MVHNFNDEGDEDLKTEDEEARQKKSVQMNGFCIPRPVRWRLDRFRKRDTSGLFGNGERFVCWIAL